MREFSRRSTALLVAATALFGVFALAGTPPEEQKSPGVEPATKPPAKAKPAASTVASPKPASPKHAGAQPAQPSSGATSSAVPARPIAPSDFKKERDAKSGEEVLVISNEDLERVFGHSGAKRAAATGYELPPLPGPGAAPAPAAGPEDAQRARQIQDDIARLKRAEMQMRNPYLGKPQLTDEERQKQQGQSNAQRIEQTKKELAQLQAELQKMQPAPPADESSPPNQ